MTLLSPPESKPASSLSKLQQCSTIVADTGDFDQLKLFHPTDSTTNPSLLLQATKLPQYQNLVNRVIERVKRDKAALVSQMAQKSSQTAATVAEARSVLVDEIFDELIVSFGCEILKLIPGVVSTEVDARWSFDTEASIAKARKLVSLYEREGYERSRVLVKLASTWEGCQAAKVLQAEGINCNMTLLFSLPQAMIAAEAGAFLISPFVGRILDWYKAKDSTADFTGEKDPGVQSVRAIYRYYKKHNYTTVIMGASFRNVSEIKLLAGCDRLTISPALLKELQEEQNTAELNRCLTVEEARIAADVPDKKILSEKTFRWMLNEDRMATEKLSDGIRNFYNDGMKLRELISTMI